MLRDWCVSPNPSANSQHAFHDSSSRGSLKANVLLAIAYYSAIQNRKPTARLRPIGGNYITCANGFLFILSKAPLRQTLNAFMAQKKNEFRVLMSGVVGLRTDRWLYRIALQCSLLVIRFSFSFVFFSTWAVYQRSLSPFLLATIFVQTNRH